MAKLLDIPEPVNALYYGDGGTGKTTHLMRMARLGRIMVINAEGGLKASALARQDIPLENIEVYPDPGSDLDFNGVESIFKTMRGDLAKNPDSWAGVVWDSATEIVKVMLDHIRDYKVEKAENEGKERDPFFIGLEDYGVMTEQMRLLVRRFRDLPCHFGVSALERRDQDNDGTVKYGPAITPALATDLFGYVDVVAHTQVARVGGVEEFQAQFRPEGKWRAKDRFGALPRLMVDPTFDRVVDYVSGKIESPAQDEIMIAAKERRRKDREDQE